MYSLDLVQLLLFISYLYIIYYAVLILLGILFQFVTMCNWGSKIAKSQIVANEFIIGALVKDFLFADAKYVYKYTN